MALKPMLASPSAVVPEGDEWVMEPKFDGWRALYTRVNGEGKLTTRTGGAINTVPYILEALDDLPDSAMLDGEIVDLSGGAQWNRTQTICSRKKVHVPTPDDPALTYVVFDILSLDDEDLKGETFEQRRTLLAMLHKVLPRTSKGAIALAEQHPCDDKADDVYTTLVEQGWEGVVCKRLDSYYSPGARNGSWLKVKPDQEVDAVCTGTYAPEVGSKYEGVAVGGITFEVAHDDGTSYNGRAAGMDDALREDLLNNEAEYVGKVVVIAHAGIGKTGALRFPRWKRFRDPADKPALDLREEVKGSGTNAMLLERALTAEEGWEREKARADELDKKLKAVVKRKVSSGTGGRKKRNYGAMGNTKLLTCIQDLRAGSGDAWNRAKEVGDPADDLREAEAIAHSRSLSI